MYAFRVHTSCYIVKAKTHIIFKNNTINIVELYSIIDTKKFVNNLSTNELYIVENY